MLTEHQDELLATIYEQVTGTYDPTGRGVEMNDHDHIKWLAAKQAKMDEKLDKIIAKLGAE